MLARTRVRSRRRGAALVEAAVVIPVFLLLVVGGVVLGLGLFRYQEVAHLARESARWASLQDASLRTNAQQMKEQILANVLTPKAVGIQPKAITVATTSTAGSTTVTLSYAWTPEAYLPPVTFVCEAQVWNPY